MKENNNYDKSLESLLAILNGKDECQERKVIFYDINEHRDNTETHFRDGTLR